MSKTKAEKRRKRKQESERRGLRIARRNRRRQRKAVGRPMLSGAAPEYEFSERSVGLAVGGIGAVQAMTQGLGLAQEIDGSISLLKKHLPYHDSDHVLNVAYNALAGGTCLEDLESLRTDEAYVRALGASRIPDPTTAADYCRRLSESNIEALQDAYNRVRVAVWKKQPKAFFDQAVIDVDGTLVETLGECKEEMDIDYQGRWGYQTLLVSLANTREPLFLRNRPGNRPSEEGAAPYLDRAIELCQEAGFRQVLLRGDTAFSQTQHLDGWDAQDGVSFLFGYDAAPNLVRIAKDLPNSDWKPLHRHPTYEVQTHERAKPERVKERVIRKRKFVNIKLICEHVTTFEYRPGACEKSYRMIVVRKMIRVLKGQQTLRDEFRYLFYITNDHATSANTLVRTANQRCEQENLIEQLKNGPRSLRAPLDNLLSNWAYMVMASLAWSLKAWMGLLLTETGRWADVHRTEKWQVIRMEFRGFVRDFIQIPALLVSTGRRLILKLISWNSKQRVFLRMLDVLERPLLC